MCMIIDAGLMKITEIDSLNFDTEHEVKAATLSAPGEFVMLLSSGDVIRFNFKERKGSQLFSLETGFTYRDGGYDLNEKSSIYTLDDLVVVANNYGRHAYLHYPGKFHRVHLWRGEYHTEHCDYPLAFYKNEEGTPHLIYANDWNQVHIMKLDNLQVLTATKSLIEEGAEERHLKFYESREDENKRPWPRPYDYFYGRLSVSPDNKKFLSAGWAWGSHDAYNVYDIAQFIQSNRIDEIHIGGGEHENRAACWFDHETVAITYNPLLDDDEGAAADSPCELHFYQIKGNESLLQQKIPLPDKAVFKSVLHYDPKLRVFLSLLKEKGLLVFSPEGKLLLEDREFKADSYNSDLQLFIHAEGKLVRLYAVEE